MNQIQTYELARSLYQEHGAKAMHVAAEKAVRYEAESDTEKAQTWRRIEAAIAAMRGPPES